LRKSFGSNFISAFGAGCSGDLNHINVNKKEPFKGMEVSERIGATLGRAVVQSSTNLPLVSRPSFAVRSTVVMVPLQQPTPQQLADTHAKYDTLGDPKTDFFEKVKGMKILDLEKRGPAWPMEVQAFRLDANTAIVCLPCEVFAELGLATKTQSPFRNTMVISICNDRPSYVPTKKAFEEGSYEVTNARAKPGAGEMLVDAAVRLLRQLR
jgi:neutral ceramidase